MKRAVLLAALVLAGCAREHAVALMIDRNGTSGSAALRVEIYDGADCANLSGRTPRASASIAPSRPAPLPGLPAGSYTVVVSATDPSCQLVGRGCRPYDTSMGSVTVVLEPASGRDERCAGPDAGVVICSPGASCVLSDGTTGDCCAGACVSQGTCSDICMACVATGMDCCQERCVDLASDESNCRECGRTCGNGQTCSAGNCVGGQVLRVGSGGTTPGTDVDYVAYWFQLDSRDPDQSLETITRGRPTDPGGEVQLALSAPQTQEVQLCSRPSDCVDERTCLCAGDADQARLAFGLVAASRSIAGGNDIEPLAYADVILVYASRLIAVAELDTLAPNLGLADTFRADVREGVTPYQIGTDGRLVATDFSRVYTMGSLCDATNCPPPSPFPPRP